MLERARSRGRARARGRPVRAVLALAAALGLAGCGEDGGPRGEQGTVVVRMIDNAFSPRVVRVPVGARVVFRNIGRNSHNAIANDERWSTERTYGDLEMPQGARTVVDFPEPGVYPYLCSFHATEDGGGMVGAIVVGDVDYRPAGVKRLEPVARASGVTRRVPQEYPDIQSAVDAAEPGDLVLVDRGVYAEEVVVTTPSLVIRGVDRNEVILDGEFERGNGIMVVEADGVAIENMTARNHLLNGFFWSGVEGYRGSYLTAYNNLDYGIYAYASVDGVFEHSYASGSPDAGFYIGQCYPCRAIIDDVIAVRNAIGYSGTNSGGELYIVNSWWSDNFAGIVPNTLDSELGPPERETTIVGNVIFNNQNPKAPSRQLEFPVFGNGIFISGGVRNRIERNIIRNHANHGVLIAATLDREYWPALGNVVRDNVILGSGRADIAIGGPGNRGNCFAGNEHRTSLPPALEWTQGCTGLRLPMANDTGVMWALMGLVAEAQDGDFPHGAIADQPIPRDQPQMPGGAEAPVRPAVEVFENHGLDLDAIELPLKRWVEIVAAGTAAATAPAPNRLATR